MNVAGKLVRYRTERWYIAVAVGRSGAAVDSLAGITVTLPKPMTSTAKARGRFGKQDFCYIADEDVYICPAGERLRADMGRKLCGYVYRNPDGTLEDGNEYVAADVFDVHEFSVKQYSLRRLTKRR